jgi:Fe-S-cluster containining protein
MRVGTARQIFYLSAVPIFHECQRCTACCRWPGIVRLTDAEITRLAAHKGLTEYVFIQRFTRLADDRRGLVLANNDKGECILLDGNDCSVHPVKPQQCRDFPNLWNFPGFERVCQAIPRLVSDAEYQRLIKVATGRQVNPPPPPQPLAEEPVSPCSI